MLYEAMLVKLKRRRAQRKKDSNGVTALEVLSYFTYVSKMAYDLRMASFTRRVFYFYFEEMFCFYLVSCFQRLYRIYNENQRKKFFFTVSCQIFKTVAN